MISKICTLCLVLTLSVFLGCSGAEYFVANVKVDRVYSVTGMTKNQIYNKTLKWVALNTGWSNSVIDYKDGSVGTIIVKSSVPTYDYAEIVYIPCVFEFNMKDDKVNIKIGNNDKKQLFRVEDRNGFRDELNAICEDYNKYLLKDDDF
jgi:hypothetical protein